MSDGFGTASAQVALHINDAEASARNEFEMVSIMTDPDDFDYDGFTRAFIDRATEPQKQLVDACQAEGEERCSADPLTTILWRISQREDWREHRHPLVFELLNLEKNHAAQPQATQDQEVP